MNEELGYYEYPDLITEFFNLEVRSLPTVEELSGFPYATRWVEYD
jgi:hypothetical protein